jgi:ribosomal-protein-alanine N-acetyltransferase
LTLPTLHFPDSVPELLGDRVRLRELTEDDVPAWFERASDPESSELSGDPIPESAEAGVQWLRLHRERFRRQAGIRWAIVPRGSTESVGSIGLAVTSSEERIAELGAVIARACWGKGLGTSAARLVIRYAFDTLRLAEIRAEFLQSNLASKRVLEKLGFRFQGAVAGDPRPGAVPDGFLYVLRSVPDCAPANHQEFP